MIDPKPGRPRILLADDEESLRMLLRPALEHAGYDVTAVENGERALEELECGEFDLLLIDVWMPRVTGLDVLEHLKSRGRMQRAIVMTGDHEHSTMVGAMRGQAYQLLPKPFAIDSLLELIGKALASTSTAPPIEVLSATRRWIELLVPCERESADRIHEFMMRLKSDLDEEVREAVGHAFRELLLNAVEWGGGLDPTRQVRISFVRGDRALIYRISDPGKGFRFEELPHAAVSNPDDSPIAHVAVREGLGLRPGGLGILMARAIVDELIYNEAQNDVIFIKYLGGAPQRPDAANPEP